MTSLTQPLRDEHRELLPRLDLVREAADAIGEAPQSEISAKVTDALAFLRMGLLPHARAEEAALYPAVGRALGAPQATATMSIDHKMIARGVSDIAQFAAALPNATPEQLRQLRSALYSVDAVTRVHFVKEEEVYLPLLDNYLDAASAAAMFRALEAAAADAKRAAAAA